MEKHEFAALGETLYTEKLPNGLTIALIPKAGFHKTCAMFATNYGGADRRFRLGGRWIDTPAGVAHFLEHKMFDMPDGRNVLGVLSANGASPNAFTSASMTAYHFQSTTLFMENLRILLEFVSTPYFTPESAAKEQGIIGQEIRMVEDSPGSVVYYNLLKCLYAHNFVRDSVAGTVESIAEIDADTLYNCHKVFYNPSNMFLCAVGELEPERVIALAREMLPPEPGEVPARDYGPEEAGAVAAPRMAVEMAVSAPQFLLGARFDSAPAGPARLRQSLTAALAAEYLLGTASPFYNQLYKEGLLNRSFSAGVDYAAGGAVLVAGGESREPEAVLAALEKAVAEVKAAGVDAVRFQRVKRAFYGGQLRALDRFFDMCYTMTEDHFGGFDTLERFAALEAIGPEAVAAFLTDTLAPERLALSCVLPKS